MKPTKWMEHALAGEKIKAIIVLRESTTRYSSDESVGLRHAKDIVESFMAEQGPTLAQQIVDLKQELVGAYAALDRSEQILDNLREWARPDDGWIEWTGGDCPVDFSAEVEARLSGGVVIKKAASNLLWNHSYGISNVVAYKVVD